MEKKTAAKAAQKKNKSHKQATEKPFLVVGLGASAGGVRAIQEFFAAMPPNSGMAFVVILHLSPEHESRLAQIIQSQTEMPVTVVNEAHRVEPNRVYVIPPNHQLEMFDGTIRCTELAGKPGVRVAIDVFFRTLADSYDSNAVCIVLSGTGADGTIGLKRVKERNGFAIVQDPRDAEYEQMPRSAIATNMVDWVLPVRQMPENLIRYRDSSERLRMTDGDDGEVAREIQADESLREILTLLKVRTGHDFSNYKTATLIRRIARHLQIHNLPDIPSYLAFLREKPGEIQALQKNLLINVTNFFRDKDAFGALEREVVPSLFRDKTSKDSVRVWSVGCASGEEAYSLAMLLWEHAERQKDPPKIQIFATDVDDEAIAEARENRYPETIAEDVSPKRLKKFFVRESGFYRVKKELRELILFAPHNVLRDPPFSRLDLVVCRNLLIYLNRDTQERVMEVFHFALASRGYLFLGNSESADHLVRLFSPFDKNRRIYARRPSAQSYVAPPRMPVAGTWTTALHEREKFPARDAAQSLGEVHIRLLEKLAPPSILVNQDFDVQYLSESAGRYLRFKGGELSNNLLKLVHPDLLADIRTALFAAQRERKSSEFRDVPVKIDDAETLVNVIVRVVDAERDDANQFLLVVFLENDEQRKMFAGDGEKQELPLNKDDAMNAVVRRLEEDLMRTRENLRATIEQHEISIEELKASNEELQAINEELRSATEELETSKEELQSVNEELVTVNSELKEKIDETTRANSDLQNLMASTDIATIFLDRDFGIKRYTPPVQNLFNVTPLDIGRSLAHFTHRFEYENLSEDIEQVLASLGTIEREIKDKDNQTYLMRVLPYRTLDDRIDGVVLNFIDITKLKEIEERLRESGEQFRRAIEEAPIPIIMQAEDGEVLQISRTWTELTGYEISDMPTLDAWLNHAYGEGANQVRDYMQDLFSGGRRNLNVEFALRTRTGEDRFWSMNASSPGALRDGRRFVVGMAVDITDRKNADKKKHKNDDKMRLLIESANDYAIFTLTKDNVIDSWSVGAEGIFGWSETEIIGKSGDILFTAEDRERNVPAMEIECAVRTGKAEDERWHVRRDNSRFYASGVMQPLQDGEGFVKICRDQTDKLKAETALHDKELLTQLIAAQEEERRRIARDIHDHLGQQMTSIRLKFESLKERCEDAGLCAEIEELQRQAEQLDRDVDFLAWELRPAALDDLGLRITLANFVKEWSEYSRVRSEFHSTGLGRKRLAYEVETNLYRIAQEALNNIYKHAKAGNVSVLLEKHKNTIALIIEDDGDGFNVRSRKNLKKGMGLAGMRERAAILGGTLEIESEKGKGTTVFVRVPARFDRKEEI